MKLNFNDSKTKHPNAHLLKEIEKLEAAILELSNWESGMKLSEETTLLVGTIRDEQERDLRIDILQSARSDKRSKIPASGKLYLSEIIEKEKIELKGSNLLILSPVGSGKTTLIKKILNEDPCKALMLVSNTALKDSISPQSTFDRKKKANNTFTTKNKTSIGNEKYTIHVMTYKEFGKKVRFNDSFLEEHKYVFCDEIHSLPIFQEYEDDTNLSHAVKSIFRKYLNTRIFYFTATDESILKLEKEAKGLFEHVSKYDFRDNPDIKQNLPLSEYRFNHIEQIRSHLKSRIKSFNYFGYKCLAFTKSIQGQKRLAEMAESEGFVPLVLWSINNDEYEMTEEQLRCRDILLETGDIPEPYNFLIINSSMQEGWDLTDSMVKLVIMNTTSETERIQATGRLRADMDILVYRVKREEEVDMSFTIPDEYLNEPLTKSKTEELCLRLDLRNENGYLTLWPSLKKLILADSIYTIENSTRTIDGKRTRVNIIRIKSE